MEVNNLLICIKLVTALGKAETLVVILAPSPPQPSLLLKKKPQAQVTEIKQNIMPHQGSTELQSAS